MGMLRACRQKHSKRQCGGSRLGPKRPRRSSPRSRSKSMPASRVAHIRQPRRNSKASIVVSMPRGKGRFATDTEVEAVIAKQRRWMKVIYTDEAWRDLDQSLTFLASNYPSITARFKSKFEV